MWTFLVTTWALAYPVGHLILWQLVERERRALPGDAYGDPEPIGISRPHPDALTQLGWQRWRRARRFSVLGLLGWLALVALMFAIDLLF